MSMFAGLPKGVIEGAAPDSRTPKLTGPANVHGRVRCVRHKVSDNPSTEGWNYYHMDFTVLSSDNPGHPENTTRGVSISFPPVSAFEPNPGTSQKKKNTNDHILRGIGALKGLQAAALGKTADQITESDLEELTASPFLLADRELVIQASDPIPSNNPNGRPWFRYDYYPATADEVARVGALAAQKSPAPGGRLPPVPPAAIDLPEVEDTDIPA